MTKSKRFGILTAILMLAVSVLAIRGLVHQMHKTAQNQNSYIYDDTIKPGYVYNNVFHADAAHKKAASDCGHAVVCGGIPSISAYLKILNNNPVVAQLYASLGPVHTAVIEKDIWAYVIYRVGDKFYWTKKKRLIKAGERIITDGHGAILMRCGNLFSVWSPGETITGPEPEGIYPPDTRPSSEAWPAGSYSSSLVPSEEIPIPPPSETTDELSVPLVGTTDEFPAPPVEIPPSTCCFTPSVPTIPFIPTTPTIPYTPPPVPTPEPSGGLMLLFGLILVIFLGQWVQRSKVK